MSLLRNFLVFLVLTLLTVSCANLWEKMTKRSDIEGEGADDIVSKDMDSDATGSDSGKINGLSSVYFAYDSSVLSSSAKEALENNVKWIKKNSKVSRIELEGHCDPMGSEAYNIGLGLRRAQAVKTFLSSLGISGNKFSIVSYGEERPLSQVDNSKNRRVNFVPIY